ncbi:MAG: hypothetical protein IT261_02405 [Saprospiraceae bacterium]|nr:hypothetical protein [Saprospiraceae bacterium]
MELVLLLAHLLLTTISPDAITSTDCGDTSNNGTVIDKGGENENADYIINNDIMP